MQDRTAGAYTQPWYRSLDRQPRNTLFASTPGWRFEGYETYALILTIGVALRQLLEPSQYSQIPQYAGLVIGLTLLGWGIGGMIVGIAIGAEWATGASIVAELWPDRARGKGAGLMQCGLGIGFFLASLIWVFVGPLGPGAWRYMYFIGVLPALFTLWVRRNIPESPLWEQ